MTVTYGERARLCIEVLNSLELAQSDQIIVVDNGSTEANRLVLEDACRSIERCRLVRLPRNEGSAGGYYAGISCALEEGVDLILCLDDDNVPETAAVDRLRHHFEDLAQRTGHHPAIVGYRTSFPNYREAAAGAAISDGHPSRSSFLSLSVADSGKYVRRRLRRFRPPAPPGEAVLEGLPFAPYGGLLVDTDTVKRVGLPDRRLVLYGDDIEWTHRIASESGIYLALDCPINDIDSTWADGATGNMLHQLAVGSSRQRYFIVRNLVNFEYSAWRSNKLLYLINKAVVLALVRAMAALRGDRSLWSDVITAVRSGEASDLSASPALD